MTIKQLFLTLGLLVITFSVFSQSKLTPKQIAKRNYQEVIGDRDTYLEKYKDSILPDKFPMYPGGMQGIYDDLSKNLSYPHDAWFSGIEGTVILEFEVEEDGTIKEIEILKSVDPELDAEAVRVIKKLDTWVPGYFNEQPVRFTYIIPIIFHIQREISGMTTRFKSARSKITWVGETKKIGIFL